MNKLYENKDMSSGLVSVIIASFNGHDRISDAIRSVLNQTHSNLELIIVDDASEPTLKPIVYKFNDPRIKYLRLDKNSGCHAARAKAIKYSSGNYIALLDDDDYWKSDKLEKQLTIFSSDPKIGLVCCGAMDIYPDGFTMPRIPVSKVITHTMELVDEKTIASTVLFKKEAYYECGGFDSKLRRCADWDCWVRLSKKYDIYAIMEPLVITRMRPNSLQRSDDVEAFAEDRFKVLKKNRDALNTECLWKEALSWHYHSMGVRYFKIGQFVNARKFLIKAIQKKPRSESIATLSLAWPFLNRFYHNLRSLGRSYKHIIRTSALK